jgi:hypothetical protein
VYFGRKEPISSIFSLASLFYPEDVGSTFPQNTGNYSPDYVCHTPYSIPIFWVFTAMKASNLNTAPYSFELLRLFIVVCNNFLVLTVYKRRRFCHEVTQVYSDVTQIFRFRWRK